MKTKKLIFTPLLVALMLAGCGETPASTDSNSDSNSGNSDTSQSSSEESVKLSVDVETLDLKAGEKKKINVTVTPESKEDEVVFSTHSPLIATVNAFGEVTGVSAGSTIIVIRVDKTVAAVTVNVSSEGVEKVDLTQDMLDKFKLGYAWEGYYYNRAADSDEKALVAPVKAYCTTDKLYYRQWKIGNEDYVYPATGKPDYYYNYCTNRKEDPMMLYDAQVDWSNNVTLTPFKDTNLTGISWPMTWEDSGFSNVFYDLHKDYFTDNGNNSWSLNLNKTPSEIKKKIAQQFNGFFKFTLSKFILLSGDGKNITSFKAVMAPYDQKYTDGSYGDSDTTESAASVITSYEGTFVDSGANVYKADEPKPFEGTKKDLFDQAMNKLANQNYTISANQDDKDYWEGKVANGALFYETKEHERYEYVEDPLVSTGNFVEFQSDDSHVTKAVKINNKYYKTGAPKTGKLSLPTFKMSSVFFDEDTTNEDTSVTVYKIKDGSELPFTKSALMDTKDSLFSPFTGIRLNDVTVTIKKDLSPITFKNKSFALSDTLTYTNVGSTTADTNYTPEENTSSLNWNDVLSYQTSSYANLTKNYINKDVLAKLPMLDFPYVDFEMGEMSLNPNQGYIDYKFGLIKESEIIEKINQFNEALTKVDGFYENPNGAYYQPSSGTKKDYLKNYCYKIADGQIQHIEAYYAKYYDATNKSYDNYALRIYCFIRSTDANK